MTLRGETGLEAQRSSLEALQPSAEPAEACPLNLSATDQCRHFPEVLHVR